MSPAHLAAATSDAAGELDGDLAGYSLLGVEAGTSKLTLEERLFTFLTPVKYKSISVETDYRRVLRWASGTVRSASRVNEWHSSIQLMRLPSVPPLRESERARFRSRMSRC
jgi:hypothetical protein